jgi:hypothetical protein
LVLPPHANITIAISVNANNSLALIVLSLFVAGKLSSHHATTYASNFFPLRAAFRLIQVSSRATQEQGTLAEETNTENQIILFFNFFSKQAGIYLICIKIIPL